MNNSCGYWPVDATKGHANHFVVVGLIYSLHVFATFIYFYFYDLLCTFIIILYDPLLSCVIHYDHLRSIMILYDSLCALYTVIFYDILWLHPIPRPQTGLNPSASLSSCSPFPFPFFVEGGPAFSYQAKGSNNQKTSIRFKFPPKKT